MASGGVFAVSDLHLEHPENRELVRRLRPRSDRDWLILGGDVADSPERLEWALLTLRDRFAKLIWVPGNHELLAWRDEALRGERRYRHLVELCRRAGAVTPEDRFPVWAGEGGPVRIAPLFLLYDYSFGLGDGVDRAAALRRAQAAGVVCVDEFLLSPDPYPSREAWCRQRVSVSERRLAGDRPDLATVLVNHFPLIAEPTAALLRPEFAQWCGTVLTADWHRRFRARAAVYGHLHIPRTTWKDGVRFEEVSMGYPRERRAWGRRFELRRILPEPPRA